MATAAEPGDQRSRHCGGEAGGKRGADRFREKGTAARLLRNLLRPDASDGPEFGNADRDRSVKNATHRAVDAGQSPSRDRQRAADSFANAQEEKGKQALAKISA